MYQDVNTYSNKTPISLCCLDLRDLPTLTLSGHPVMKDIRMTKIVQRFQQCAFIPIYCSIKQNLYGRSY